MGIKFYTNELGHMTKMAAMPIYDKNLQKSSFPELNRPMALGLGMTHWIHEYYQDCCYDDLVLTLTFLRQGQLWENANT